MSEPSPVSRRRALIAGVAGLVGAAASPLAGQSADLRRWHGAIGRRKNMKPLALVAAGCWLAVSVTTAQAPALPLGIGRPAPVVEIRAYLLFQNGVIAEETAMDRTSLPNVVMPAHGHFVPDNRQGGPTVR